LLYISTLVFRIRNQEATQAQPLDAWALLRIIPEMIVAGWLAARLFRRGPAAVWIRFLFQGLPGALTMFALVCVASTFWSVYPAWTLFKSLEYMLDIFVLAAALANIGTLQAYETMFSWVWVIFGVELAWVWLQWPLWPSESLEDGRLKGVLPATGWNAVGQSGALFAVIAICKLLPIKGSSKPHRGWCIVLFVFGMASLLLSQTRNTVAGFAFAALLVLVLSRRTWLAVAMSVLGGLVAVLTPIGPMIVTYLQREQSADAMASLTGRADFWGFAWDQFLQNPLTGLGAYAAGRFYIMTKLGIDTATLHSDWVELLVGVGLLGFIPFVTALLGTWWVLLRSIYDYSFTVQERQMALEAAGVLAVITVHSFFNDELTWHAPLLLLVILGYAEMLRRRRKGRVRAPRAALSFLARPVNPTA
jgi:O-antigen ligase